MTTPRSVQRLTRRSASFIGSVILAGRVLERFGAFGQILLIAAFFGATTDADLYFIASIVPLFVGGVVGEALYVTVLPSFSQQVGDDRISELVRAGFWLSTAILVAVTIVYAAIAAVVVGVAAPAGSDDLGPWLAFAPIGILLGLGSYLSAVLLRYERYVWPPFRSAAATLVGLGASALALSLSGRVVWVALAVAAGYGVALIMLVLEVASVAGWRAFGAPARDALRELALRWRKFGASILGGLIGGQVFVLVERALAASLGVGAVAAISYARGVAFTPGVLAQSISMGLYPGMLRAHAAKDSVYLRTNFIAGLRLTIFVALCTASYLALYSPGIADALFSRGRLTSTSLLEIERALAAFSLAVMGSMLMIYTSRVFSALDRFREIVVAQSFALAVYAPLAFLLRPELGPAGLALAFGIAELSGALLAVVRSARLTGLSPAELAGAAVLPAVVRGGAVFAALLLVRFGIDPEPSITEAGGGLVAGAMVALFVLWVSGWPEVAVLRRVARRLRL